jgi:hypothetical protein
MNECLNCEEGIQCYECYILSGKEDRDNKLFDILMGYERKDLAMWLMDILPESAIDEILASEKEIQELDQ